MKLISSQEGVSDPVRIGKYQAFVRNMADADSLGAIMLKPK